ncbi:MAG: hypothetical protein MUF00_16335 [Gemmatimonadaceae bacterium]|nr:hypothetical protein [Gemmatimonadaceae bacterium]
MARGAWRAVTALEWRLQAREPLTWLYALVFLALSTGFVASDTVALVPRALRGDAPATAPFVLALALSGLGAFGQVITTMITITAMLRDTATRAAPLVLSTAVSTRSLLGGRWAAALLTTLVVSLGMPCGVLLGVALRGGAVIALFPVVLALWVVLVVPTVLLTASVQAWVAARTASLYATLGATLLLLVLWQLTTSSALLDRLGPWWAAVDPFGSAPLLLRARQVCDLADATPWFALLLWNRAGIAALGVLVAALVGTLSRPPHVLAHGRSRADDAPADETTVLAAPPARTRSRNGRAAGAMRASCALTVALYGRERALRVIAVLAALNVGINVWAAVSGAPHAYTVRDALALADTHGRLFLVLLATIYAGELRWRDRDGRTDALVETMPATTTSLLAGQVIALAWLELCIAILVTAAAYGAALLSGVAPAWRDVLDVSVWAVAVCFAPFFVLTCLSLAVHALIGHKVAAHLLLIVAWVVAVSVDGGDGEGWPRIASVSPAAWAPSTGATMRLWWSVAQAALLALCTLAVARWWWPRGVYRARVGR